MWYSLDNDFKHEGDVVLNICGTNNTHVTLIDRAGKCSKRDKTESKLGPSGFWEIFDHPGSTQINVRSTNINVLSTQINLRSTVCLRSVYGLAWGWYLCEIY